MQLRYPDVNACCHVLPEVTLGRATLTAGGSGEGEVLPKRDPHFLFVFLQTNAHHVKSTSSSIGPPSNPHLLDPVPDNDYFWCTPRAFPVWPQPDTHQSGRVCPT